jgi:hypothetical protein
MRSPILYEINTRVWLRELSNSAGHPVTLADIPESEIATWKELGFTHIWLMGVWQVGKRARDLALAHWRGKWRSEIPSTEEDVQGSPFAVQEYSVDSRVGQPLDLLLLKERLGRAGIKLIIDLIPNHFGIDSSEPNRYPARFVQAATNIDGTYSCETKFGTRFFAHGRDPYFPPWIDTVQVDYRVAEAQDNMSSIAQTISMFGDGLRCDMAMLLLPDVFRSTWKDLPSVGTHLTEADFWRTTIPKIRMLQPHVDLIAEAYWDREADLQEAGFDYTYNKRVTDYLVRGHDAKLIEYLHSCTPRFLKQSVHFLENHDEQRAAQAFEFGRHKAAAALILFLPGMVLLHDGQLEGRRQFAPIQMSKRAVESVDSEVQRFYAEILKVLQQTPIRRGTPTLRHFESAPDLIAIEWQGGAGVTDFGIVNLGETSVLPSNQLASPPECLYSTSAPVRELANGDLNIPTGGHILRLKRN